jgi:membrane associated rhomboid family serine protease
VASDDGDETEGSSGGIGGIRGQWATLGLIGLNVSVFLAMMLAGASPLFVSNMGDLVGAGAVEPLHVWDGEVWRLFVACFVHLGIWHLALNMWVLWQLGRALEHMVGGSRLLLIYASSGVFGFAVSLALHSGPTAGASGAVFGVTGALLALALLVRHGRLGRVLFSALLPFVLATFVLGILVPFVDNTAHVGGILFGALLGFGLSAGDRSFLGQAEGDHAIGPRERVLGLVALLVSGLLFAAVTVYAVRPVLSPRYHAVMGLADLAAHRLADAEQHEKRAKALGPNDAATLFLEGRVAEEKGNAAEARRLITLGIKRLDEKDMGDAFKAAIVTLSLAGGDDEVPFSDPKTMNSVCDAMIAMLGTTSSPEVKNDCAWVKLKAPAVHDEKTGLVLARQAVADSGGKDANNLQTLAEALAQNGDAAEGLALMEKLAAEGRGDELPGGQSFLDSECKRLKALAAQQRKRVGSP